MSGHSPYRPTENQLLALLPDAVLAALLPKLAAVPLQLRDVIYRTDGPIDAVYFPLSGMISLVTLLDDGMHAEVGIVGQEGLMGVSLNSGSGRALSEAVVQLPGAALRLPAAEFLSEFDSNGEFRKVLLRYNEALHAQVMQTAACNGRHSLEARLARWLLMASDRAGAPEMHLTQDFMAMMLGVHRPSLTVTAGILQRAGLIRYAAGRVTVLNRDALEAASCECYDAVNKRYADLMYRS